MRVLRWCACAWPLMTSAAFAQFDTAAVVGNRSAASFGTITATYDPRQLQLGFKLLHGVNS